MIKVLNKKGFTLIEILGVIIILSILGLIAMPVFTNILKGSRDDYYKNLEGTLKEAGGLFFTDNRVYRPSGLLQTTTVSTATLSSNKYVSAVADYNGDSCKSSYVIIIKMGNNDYDYAACLKCSYDDYKSSNKYCENVWKLNSNIDYQLQDPATVTVYLGTSREEIREKVKLNTWVVKHNELGQEIGRVDSRLDSSSKTPVIYPNNLDTIDTNQIGNYTLNYSYEGQTKTGLLVIHRDATVIYWTVSYDCNGISCSLGTTSVKQGYAYGTLLTPPNREGHTFDGWYTAATGGTKITSASVVNLTSNQTLYAHWL